MNRPGQQSEWRRGLDLVGGVGGRARRRRGRRPFHGSHVERLEDRTLLSTLDIGAGKLTYNADVAALPSDLTISVDPANTADALFTDTIQGITLGAGTLGLGWAYGANNTQAIGPLSSFTSVLVSGDATTLNQALTVDFTDGDPLPAAGLTFTPGGGGTNTLSLLSGTGGTTFTSETYTASGPGAGTMTYSDSSQSNVPVTFTNLTPIDDSVSSPTFTFTAPAAATTVNVNADGVIGGAQADQINDGGTGAFELANFANKTAVTVNVPASGATTTLNIPTLAAGLSSLKVVSGGGNDTVDVQAIPAGLTGVTVDTGAASGSTTHVGLAGSLAAIASPVTILSTGGANTLALDDSAEATGQTYTLTGSRVTGSSMPSHVDFGTGITTLGLNTAGHGDTVSLIGLKQADVATYKLSADGGPGPNTLNVDVRPDNISTVDAHTPGVLTFGPGNPVVDYSNFQVVNISKPASPPAGTAMTIAAAAGQPLSNVPVATFTESDQGTTPADFTALINWGDGTVNAGTIQSTGPNSYNILGSHVYAVGGTYTVGVTLTALGSTNSSLIAGTRISVTSAGPVNSTPNPISSSTSVASAPLSAQGATVTGKEGGTLTPDAAGDVIIATFMDTGTPGATTDYSATVDWGDGTTSSTGGGGGVTIKSTGMANGVVFSIIADHKYAEEGTYPISVTITRTPTGTTPPPGPTAIALGQAVIGDAALTAAAAAAIPNAHTGQLLPAGSIIGSFKDANTSAPIGDFTATIDWGGGSPTGLGTVVAGTTAGTFDVEAAHAYARPGSYTPIITVHDVGGSTVTLAGPNTATIKVSDVAPTGTTNPIAAVEGMNTGMIVLATITDPNPLATVSSLGATVNWGDGTGTVPAIITPAGGNATSTFFTVSGSHTYAAAGHYTASITVTTTDGTTTTTTPLTAAVTVAAAPITATGTSISGIEGNSTGVVVVATFTDADPGATAARFTAGGGSVVVSWGDGSMSTLPASAVTATGTPNGVLFTVTAAHTYAETGHYQVTAAITGSDGAVASANGQATVADAPLTPSATQPAVSTTEDRVFSGPVGSFTDANPSAPINDFTYVTIDWGDGTSATVGTIAQPGGAGTPFVVGGTHIYADAGVNGGTGHFPITINVHDAGGATVTIANAASVADVALIVTGRLNPASDSGGSRTDNITNVVQPDFIGNTSQPGATITLYATAAGGSTPVAIGTGVSNASGAWSITADRALANGAYAITAVAVDASGHTVSSTATVVPSLVIDTAGPKMTALSFDRFHGRVVVTFQDYGGPNNAGVGLYEPSVIDANNYQFAMAYHPRVGKYLINRIADTPGTTTGPQTATLTINAGHYLRGGFYLFTIRSVSPANLSGIRDLAGNALDGEFYGYFPSGNNIPGGNFVARLTAIHHVIYAPATASGRATPVNPPGARQHNVYVPATVNPSRFPRAAAATSRSRSVRQADRAVRRAAPAVSRRVAGVVGPMIAATPAGLGAAQPLAMGALGVLDQALDQVATPGKHRRS